MAESTPSAGLLATLGPLFPVGLILQLLAVIKQIGQLIKQFRRSDPTPQSTFDLSPHLIVCCVRWAASS